MKTTRLVKPTKSAYEYPLLIKTILHQSLIYEPDNEIVYRDQNRMTYRTFNKRVAKLANTLNSIGVGAGDVVGVLEFDSNRYLELYFAVPMIGAVLHTINYRLSPEQALYTMNHAEDNVVFVHQKLLPLIKGIKPHLKTVEKYVLLKDTDDGEVSDLKFDAEYEDLLSKQSDQYDFPDFDENSMATLFYTTGTTGLPKGVCFSHRQLVLHTLAVMASVGTLDNVAGMRSNDVYMPLTPMFHVHAWGIPYVATMLGMKQVYPGPYEPQMLMKLILTEGVTFSHCVPTILGMLVNNPKAKDFDLSKFKVIIGGSALPKGLAKAALDLGIDIIAGYGMSETCPVLTVPYLSSKMRKELSEDQQVDERIKTGRPIMMVDLKLMDDDGNFLPFDGKSVGEIVTRTPWLTMEYFKEDERSEELWSGHWMHTGDMAYVEENTTVVISDRKKDVIKSGGEWISSLELESLISAHPKVNQVAVVGVPDPKWAERPLALIVKAEGEPLADEEIRSYLMDFVQKGKISKWSVPEQYKFVDDIPKTSVGKIDKKKIRALLKDGSI